MTSPRFLVSVLLLAAPLLGSCGASDPEPFLLIAGPFEIESFEIRDAGEETVWKLEADPPRPVRRLVWNRVPQGFVQSVPAPGQPPRDLVTGERLEVESRTPARIFIHTGTAKSARTMTITSSVMRAISELPVASAPGR